MFREKYLQIFNYLLEFSRLRSKPVRDIEGSNNYPEVIWLSEIPMDDKVDCILHEDYSKESNYWLKISKPTEPVEPLFPEPPVDIQPWIIPESLFYRDELPELFEEIINSNHESLLIDEHPEIKKNFENYCENKWFSDSEDYWPKKELYDIEIKQFNKINSIYKSLFSTYNKIQQLGEEFELIVGVGLLQFKKNDESPLIRRHLITTRADIQFEFSKRDSSIIISQNFDNGLQVETDAIIDLAEQFESNDILDGERRVKELINSKELINPFDTDRHT